jgi:hypothetical protein
MIGPTTALGLCLGLLQCLLGAWSYIRDLATPDSTLARCRSGDMLRSALALVLHLVLHQRRARVLLAQCCLALYIRAWAALGTACAAWGSSSELLLRLDLHWCWALFGSTIALGLCLGLELCLRGA